MVSKTLDTKHTIYNVNRKNTRNQTKLLPKKDKKRWKHFVLVITRERLKIVFVWDAASNRKSLCSQDVIIALMTLQYWLYTCKTLNRVLQLVSKVKSLSIFLSMLILKYFSSNFCCNNWFGQSKSPVEWLWETTRVREVMGLNPRTGYWMDIFSHWFVKVVWYVCWKRSKI